MGQAGWQLLTLTGIYLFASCKVSLGSLPQRTRYQAKNISCDIFKQSLSGIPAALNDHGDVMLELKGCMLELKAQKQTACIPVALVVPHRCSRKAVPKHRAAPRGRNGYDCGH